MPGRTKGSATEWIAGILVLVLFGYTAIVGGQSLLRLLETPEGQLSKIAVGAMVVAPTFFMLLAIGLFFFSRRQSEIWPGCIVAVILVGLALRLVWVFAFPTLPESDYLVNHQIARQLSRGEYQNGYPRSIGYPIFLGFLYRLYPDPVMGRLLNAVLGAGSIWLCYLIGNRLHLGRGSLAAAAVMAFLPNEIMLSSVLCTEICGMTFFLAAILGILRLRAVRNAAAAGWAGFGFGMAILFRPNLLAFIPLIVGLTLALRPVRLKGRLGLLGVYCAGILAPSILIAGWHIAVSGIWTLKPLSNPSAAYTLLSGTNVASGGTYQAEEASLYWDWPEAQRTNRSLQTAWERISGNPGAFIDLVGVKMKRMLADGAYGFDKGAFGVSGRPLGVAMYRWRYAARAGAQTYYLAVVGLAALYLAFGPRDQRGLRRILLLALLLAIAPHVLLESQPRYQHVLYPMLVLAAGQGVALLGRGSPDSEARKAETHSDPSRL